jgi:hypothetical protein
MRNYEPQHPELVEARKKARFLKELYANGGFIERTIRECKTSRRWFNETCNSDEEFEATVNVVLNATNELIEQEIYRRAVAGVEKPLAYQGQLTGATITEYSDNLLMFLAKARMPAKYRDLPQKGADVTREEMNEVIKGYLDKRLGKVASEPVPATEAVN